MTEIAYRTLLQVEVYIIIQFDILSGSTSGLCGYIRLQLDSSLNFFSVHPYTCVCHKILIIKCTNWWRSMGCFQCDRMELLRFKNTTPYRHLLLAGFCAST